MKSIKLMDLKKDCYVTWNETYEMFVVVYKDVILWATAYDNLEGCEIYLDQTDDEICICGKTPVYFSPGSYDFSTYGMWYSLDEAKQWLENPIPLY